MGGAGGRAGRGGEDEEEGKTGEMGNESAPAYCSAADNGNWSWLEPLQCVSATGKEAIFLFNCICT